MKWVCRVCDNLFPCELILAANQTGEPSECPVWHSRKDADWEEVE